MHPDVIRSYLERVPFTPVRIEKTGGVSFEVRNPAQVSLSRRDLELGLPIENAGQRFVTIALVHVVSVEIVLPLAA